MIRILLTFVIAACSVGTLYAQPGEPIPDEPGFENENYGGDVSELFGDSAWFGRYRPHFGYRYEAGDTIGRIGGLSSFDAFFPLLEGYDSDWLMFLDARLLLGDDNHNLGSNVGVGARQYIPEIERTIGTYLYYDTRDAGYATFDQVSGGIETLGDIWDARLNWYVPTGQTRNEYATTHTDTGGYSFIGHYLVGGTFTRYYQAAMKGLDMEAGAKFYSNDYMDLRAYAGWYHFQAKGSQQAWGWKSRVESRISDMVSLNLSVQNDRVFDTTVNFAVGIQWPSISGLRGGPKSDLKAWDRLGESPERLRTIVVDNQKIEDPNGGLVIDPTTGLPYFFMHVATGGNSDGSYEDPYATLAAAFADPRTQAGNVVVYDHRTGMETGNFILAGNTQVLSEGPNQFLNSTIGSIKLPGSGTGMNSQVTGSFTLYNGSVLSGFDITSTISSSILALGAGNIRVANNTITNTNALPGTPAIYLENLTGSVTFDQTTLNNTNGTALGITGGNANIIFTNSPITANNSTYAVNIQNAGGSVNLGQVNGTNSTFDAFVSGNSADVTIAELNSTGATSLPFSVQNHTGNFLLNGGTIANSAGSGGQIDNSSNVTVQNVTFDSPGGHGINVSNSSNVTLKNNTITDAGSDGIRVLNSSGNITISDNTIRSLFAAFDNAIRVTTNGASNLDIDNNIISSRLTIGNNGIDVNLGSGDTTLRIRENNISSLFNGFGDAIYVTNNSTGQVNTTITYNEITNAAGAFSDAITYINNASGSKTTTISNNTIQNTSGVFGNAINVIYNDGSATTMVADNTIDSDDTFNTFGTSVFLNLNTTGTTTSSITGNTISDDNDAALYTDGIALDIDRGTNHTVYINDNDIAQSGGIFDDGIEILADPVGGSYANIQIHDNILNNSNGAFGRGLDVFTTFGSNSLLLDVMGNSTDTSLYFEAVLGATIFVEDLPNLSTNNNSATTTTIGNVQNAP